VKITLDSIGQRKDGTMFRYSIRPLPERFHPWGLGPDGTVVGGGSERGVAWAVRDGVGTALVAPTPAIRDMYATACNAAGLVVGAIRPTGAMWRAAAFAGGVARDLGTLYGGQSLAEAVNDGGLIVGRTTAPADPGRIAIRRDIPRFRAVAHDGRGWRDLGTLGGPYSQARAVNARGDAAGWAVTPDGITRAARFRAGAAAPDDLGARTATGDSDACGINDDGLIAGNAQLADGSGRAVLFDRGALVPLASLGGGASGAFGLNNRGQVLGVETLPPPHTGERAYARARVVLWEGGAVAALDDLLVDGAGWELVQPRALNDAGQIAGMGRFRGQERAFLLTPVA